MSKLKPLHVPPPTTEEYGGFKVTKEYVSMDEFERGIKTTDIVSVVRCRDCVDFDRWDYADGKTRNVCARFEFVDVTPDGFCAWAERREP